ncbi:stonin-2-like [Acanthaster planci]|uniref:Stonin-2-like n=1 Tax=Acanthaster planci TaxID=133434 RepID=A0A8B7YX59_ACAPL|nr:stonin-2-like [Acanthaster planci]
MYTQYSSPPNMANSNPTTGDIPLVLQATASDTHVSSVGLQAHTVEISSNQIQEDDLIPVCKDTRSGSSTTTSSVSSFLCEDSVGETDIINVNVASNEDQSVSVNNESALSFRDGGLAKESQCTSDDVQVVNQTAGHVKNGILASMVKNEEESMRVKEDSKSQTGDAQNALDNQQKYLEHLNESSSVRIKNGSGGIEACSSTTTPSGHEADRKERALPSNGQTAAAPCSPCIALDETEMPGAGISAEKNGEGVPVSSSGTSVDVINNGNLTPNIARNSAKNPSMDARNGAPASSQMTTPQHPSASSVGVAASKNWVSFEEDVPLSHAPSPEIRHDSDVKKEWVKFESSPQMSRHAVVPQLTGGSSVHSFEPACDDRQSDVTMSVLSSRGSLAESQDVSHEYLPLAPSPLGSAVSSPSPHLKSTSGMSSWVRFEDAGDVPQQRMQSPPLLVPLQASSPSTVQDTASSSASPLSSPGHVAGTQQISSQVAAGGKSLRQPLAGWVSFDEADSSTPSTPIRSPVTDTTSEKRLQLQQLQQSLALQQQQQIQARQQQHIQQQQQQSPPVFQQHYPQSPASSSSTPQHVVVLPPANPPAKPLSYPTDNQQSLPSAPSTSTPLPGNPFREEMLRQQNRAASPFNPFQSGPIQTPSTPGGTVSAMWGESPITPGTVNAMWEKFEESSTSIAAGSGSPGNPFKVHVTAGANLFNAQPQQVVLSGASGNIAPDQPQLSNSQPSAVALKEQGQTLQGKNVAEQSSVPFTLSSTPAQSTPVSTQQFQRYTKGSKQVTIRASGKRPKVTQSQPTDVIVDDAPFVDEFPKVKRDLSEGWSMMLRCPDKKRVAGSRYWKPVLVKLLEGNVIQLFDIDHSSEPFRELPLQCSYEFGDRKPQAYDTLGKIHTIKLMYVSYSEKRRYNTRAPYEKVMNANPLLKLGSTDYNTFRSFISTINEYLMRLSAFRDRGISYKQDAIGVVVSDDYRCRILCNGELEKQSISVDVTVLAFLSDMPECSIALNDVQVKGLEVVSRRDIIPNKTNHWIKLENVELHKCTNKNVFVESRMIEFQPLDGCRFCLMKYQTRPRQNTELPLHVKVTVSGEGAYLELRADLYLPGRPGRRDPSQFTCENVMVRIPIPDTWIKYFRRERRLGYHSVKSTHGKPDHIKQGSLNPRLLETSIGSAKYEHAYKSIVWRIEKLPERATVFSASHILMCRIHLESHREVPRTPQGDVEVEFTMPHTTASLTTVRSLSVASNKPSEKRIRYMAHYEYFVEMENNVVLQMLDGDEGPSHCSLQ